MFEVLQLDKNKKSQLLIISVLFLFLLIIYIYSVGTSNYYNVETRDFSIMDNIISETCFIARNLKGEALDLGLKSFKYNSSNYCREHNWKCDLSIINLTALPPLGNWSMVNNSLYEFEIDYSDMKYSAKKRFIC